MLAREECKRKSWKDLRSTCMELWSMKIFVNTLEHLMDAEPTMRVFLLVKGTQEHEKIFKVWIDCYFVLTLTDIIAC